MAKSIAKKASADLVPDYLADYAGEGTENVSDLTIVPRIKLLQGLSPEVVDDGEKAGEFWHTVAESSIGDTIQMVPVYVSQSVLLWRPRKDGGGILARADDGIHWDRPDMSFDVKLDTGQKVTWNTGKNVQRSGLTEFGSMNPDDSNSYPAATKMINVIAMFPDMMDMSPAVISLQRSSFKVGQQFVSKLAISRLPSWSRIFNMTSKKDRNADNDAYFNWSFQSVSDKGSPVLVSEADAPKYKEMYDHFSSKGFAMKDEDDTVKEKDTDHDDY
tara:strand:- start:74 stop:892 length:819 start_codon:yes stop_codon:yes gene_type:complete